ncbi:hypothetical protein Ancab_003963 [Ancistrocladus abbreviatus]
MSTNENDDIDADPFTLLFPHHHQYEGESATTTTDHAEIASEQQQPPQVQHRHIPSINSTVVIRQLPSQGLSFQLWPAAATLVTLLDHHRRNATTSSLSTTLSPFSDSRLRVLELGSGTGFVGIAAAAILGVEVSVTDLGHVIPNLKFNVAANSHVLAANGGVVQVAELRWGDIDHMEAIGRDFDVILGTDVVYHDHLYEPLIETLKYFLNGGEREKETVFLMAHLKRWKKESTFFKKARKLFHVEVIHKDSPSDGKRIGVIVYRFLRKHHGIDR